MAKQNVLTAEEIKLIIYDAIQSYRQAIDPVTPATPFDSLEPEIQTLFSAQIVKIIEQNRLKPRELHANFKVTSQQMIAKGIENQELVAKLNPYMVPFNKLPVTTQTEFRLQVQLARTLLRHNRNVERAQKRQR